MSVVYGAGFKVYFLQLTLGTQETRSLCLVISGQLTWTCMHQGFKNAPTVFDDVLHEDLDEYRNQHPETFVVRR